MVNIVETAKLNYKPISTLNMLFTFPFNFML